LRYIDRVVGSSMALQVRVRPSRLSRWRVVCYTARDSITATAIGAAAFAQELIDHRAAVPAGVWFPEQAVCGVEQRRRFLQRARAAWECVDGGEWREWEAQDASSGVKGRWWWNVCSVLSVLLPLLPGGRVIGSWIPMVGRFMENQTGSKEC